MVCIYCNNETSVINSRPQKRVNRVWRRRTCVNCGTTFTSIESVDLSGCITVKNAKSLQPFLRDKLFLSIYDSLKHRKTAQLDATALTDTVITRLHAFMKVAVVDKSDIINATVETLKKFDKVASVHYQAFHPQEQLTANS